MGRISSEESQETYDVGYRKPPKRSQFKKGQSGNPKGRPRGSVNVTTSLERALDTKITITEDGVRKSVSKLEAGFKRFTDKFASGDPKAFQLVTALVRSSRDEIDDTDSFDSEADRRVLKSFVKRIETTIRKELNGEPDPVSE